MIAKQAAFTASSPASALTLPLPFLCGTRPLCGPTSGTRESTTTPWTPSPPSIARCKKKTKIDAVFLVLALDFPKKQSKVSVLPCGGLCSNSVTINTEENEHG